MSGLPDQASAARRPALAKWQFLPLIPVVWGAVAIAAVYPWGYWPLAIASVMCGVFGLSAHRSAASDAAADTLSLALASVALAAAIQLVPFPSHLLGFERKTALQQLDPVFGADLVRFHPLSIDPWSSGIALVLFGAFVLLMLGSARLLSLSGSRPLVEGLTIFAVFLALIAIIQKSTSTGLIYGLWKPVESGSPFGPFVNKNHFAGWMLMALPLALGHLSGAIAHAVRGVKPGVRNRLLWLSSAEASRVILIGSGIFVMALSLVLTMSRSGMSALAVALMITGVLVGRRHSTRTRRAVALAYLGLLCVVLVWYVGAGVIAKRFAEQNWGEFDRVSVWKDAIAVAAKFPITGTGLNTYQSATLLYQRYDPEHYYSAAHNDYLQLAAEGGLLLVAPAIVCVVLFVRAVRRRFIEETSITTYWIRTGAVTGIAAIALQEVVDFSLQMPSNACLFAVLCAIALHRTPERRRSGYSQRANASAPAQ
jgi:O-antigen ligase